MRVDTNVFFSQPGPSLPPATPQLALNGQGPGSSQMLTMSELTPLLAIAIQHWADAGASAAQIAQLEHTHIQIADLPDSGFLANTDGSGITIDTNAAGWGWFIDPTPADNSEFHATTTANELIATSGDAASHIDLLTVVEHELGHIIGLGDSTGAGVMNIALDSGERRLPGGTDVAQASEADIPQISQAPAGTPIVAGNAANNIIDAGHGGNILFGGGGADTFVFGPGIQLNAPTPAQITHVADYSAAHGDTFDFSALTSTFHNSSVSDALVVRAVEDASGKFATLQVDHIDPMGLSSAPNWVSIAQIDGAHAGDAVNVVIDNHSVHLAQIHVDLLV
jgi:large repetitive protein